MRIFYFVHVTGTDTGISGIPRVVRNLARELAGRPGVAFVPVCWREDLPAIVHAEQKLLDNLARNGGPEWPESPQARQPIEPAPGDWLLVAEAPHLQSRYPGYRSVHLDEAVGWAIAAGLKVAIVFHDILPLIFGMGSQPGRPFVELSAGALRARDDNAERLAFARYAHAAALVDLVLPVSRTAGETLRDWLVAHGHRESRLPPMTPALLPEEVFGVRRADPLGRAARAPGPVEFVAVGLVNAQKNQLTAMAAFLDLIERRPDLDLRLHVIGNVAAEAAAPASLLPKRSHGRIVLHGRLSDGQIRELVSRSRATLFVSLAEGFGLPVAESLWWGKPCLCSNSGSIGEIARGGGCLAVDPRSPKAIAAALETLAADGGRYEQLLRQIATRPLKTWAAYAGQIVGALAAVSSGRIPELVEQDAPLSRPVMVEGAAPADYEAKILVSAADLSIPGDYAAAHRPRSLFYAGAIHYDAARDGAVKQDTLFFGPYVSLPAGRYALKLDGEIEGELQLRLTAFNGEMKIAEATVTHFADPIVFDLDFAITGFEIVGVRGPRLSRLTLRSVLGDFHAAGEAARLSASPDLDWDREADAPPPLAFDSEGEAIRLPTMIAAAKLRVHEAFNAGKSNRLREGAAIAFDPARRADIGETTLFFGPYLRLEPGRYLFRFHGELSGPLNLRLTSSCGDVCHVERRLASFHEPLLLDLREPVKAVETIANATPDTRAMRLDGIEISVAPAEAASDAAPGAQAPQTPRRSLLARVLGRS